MKRSLFTILGVLSGSVLAWGGLLAWAALNLDPQDSLFDRNPLALNLFLGAWLALVVLGAVIGLRASKKAYR
ncbi:MAG: hypothetical protein QM742_03325 [Aquabacterium sp.]